MKNTILFLLLTFLFTGSLLAQNKSYRVQKEENLDSVAEKFNVSKKSILQLNPDLVHEDQLEGEVLIIPPAEVNQKTPTASGVKFKEYRVKHKETLYSLAKENDISIKDIKKYNPYLYKEELGENDMIRIPIFQKESKNFNQSITTSTFKNLRHVVMPKETKFGISKKYGMSIEELDSLNPQIDTLRIGQVIKVINAVGQRSKGKEGQFKYYEVQPKETLYSLTKRWDISQDSLEKLNPALKELGLQAGMELRIPKEMGEFSELAKTASTKVNLGDHLTNLSAKKVAIMLPFKLNRFTADSVNRKKLLTQDQYLQISLDLYEGAKAAIDSAQKLGIPVKAKVFDTQASSQKINSILSDNHLQDEQFIFGPLLPNHIKTVAKSLKDNDVAILSPLINSQLHGSDQIFQTRPTSLIKENALIGYLDSLQQGKNLLILSDSKHQSFANKFRNHFSGAQSINMAKESYLQKSDLTRVLRKNKPNWVVIESSKPGTIYDAISYLNAMRHEYDIRLFTTDKGNITGADVESEFLSHMNFTYTSIDKSDTGNEHNTFIKSYVKKNGITPNPYVVRGFDVTFDALLRSASAENIFKSLKKWEGLTEYVGNRFNYHEKKVDGYYNSAVYLIKFSEDLKLEVLN